MTRLIAALADRYRIDVWLVQFPRAARYDRLRRDPRAAAMLDRLGRGTT
jgi:hypothetical protein